MKSCSSVRQAHPPESWKRIDSHRHFPFHRSLPVCKNWHLSILRRAHLPDLPVCSRPEAEAPPLDSRRLAIPQCSLHWSGRRPAGHRPSHALWRTAGPGGEEHRHACTGEAVPPASQSDFQSHVPGPGMLLCLLRENVPEVSASRRPSEGLSQTSDIRIRIQEERPMPELWLHSPDSSTPPLLRASNRHRNSRPSRAACLSQAAIGSGPPAAREHRLRVWSPLSG